jgi:hypothetical protein
MAEISFNASEYTPVTDYELIPPGEYEAIINSAEWKDTKAGTGRYLKLEFEFTREYEGRKIWENLNLENPNEKAVQIANAALSGICGAIGVDQLTDTDQLLDKPMIIKVKIQKGKDGYDDQNRISKYSVAQDFIDVDEDIDDSDLPF